MSLREKIAQNETQPLFPMEKGLLLKLSNNSENCPKQKFENSPNLVTLILPDLSRCLQDQQKELFLSPRQGSML
jgi:hypothetical protein